MDKEKFLAVELVSCLIPFSFDAIHYYTKIFNFFMRIRTEFVNQEKLRRKIYSSAPVDNSVKRT
ncbi:8920_t:CDS:2 [Paraglomus occultum]|uniref:8920_t:CDS:1 n=1 Tax=Paraglomus occultum TaxID=144539 RepID=A0A9N9G3R8_9GLOM|nr:8920_t:CDS:2 [Paraglomus occultum]